MTNTMTRVFDFFSTLVAEDDSLPLTEAALSLAQDVYPDLDMQAVLAEFDALVLRFRRRVRAETSERDKVDALNDFFPRAPLRLQPQRLLRSRQQLPEHGGQAPPRDPDLAGGDLPGAGWADRAVGARRIAYRFPAIS